MSKSKPPNKRGKPSQKANSNSPNNNLSRHTAKAFIKNLIWVIKTIFKMAPVDATVFLIASSLDSTIPTLRSFLIARLIDQIIKIAQSDIGSISDIDITHPFFIYLGIGVAVEFLKRIARFLEKHMDKRFRIIHGERFHIELCYRASKLDVMQYENPKDLDVLRKGFESMRRLFSTFKDLSYLVSVLVSFILSAVISIGLSPSVSGILFVLTIPSSIIFIRFSRKFWNFHNNKTEERRKSQLVRGRIESARDIYEYKINKTNEFFYNLAKKLGMAYSQKEMALHTEQFKVNSLANLLFTMHHLLVPIYLVSQIINGRITIGEFSFYENTFYNFAGRLEALTSYLTAISDNLAYLEWLKKSLEIKPIIKEGTKIIDVKIPPEIEFRNVSFKYPGSNRYVLKDINLKIKPGQEIAIVGENGAGKTTLIKLLLRFYDVSNGQILINGNPIKKLSLQEYYKAVSALFQDYGKFDILTVKDNIHIGKPDKKYDGEKAEKAARDADAEDFIKKLPNKYDQVLSKSFTNGTNLSSGQWQKLALARMFYRDSPLLILDEPTASIDAEAEYRIFKRIYEFVENKTVIIISHRFSTVRNADKIYVLSDGEIIEKGSHDELLKKKGQYAKAFKMQAEGYKR